MNQAKLLYWFCTTLLRSEYSLPQASYSQTIQVRRVSPTEDHICIYNMNIWAEATPKTQKINQQYYLHLW